jgi:hypothetical protein
MGTGNLDKLNVVTTKKISLSFNLIEHSFGELQSYQGWNEDEGCYDDNDNQPIIEEKGVDYDSLEELIRGVSLREMYDDDGEEFWWDGENLHYTVTPQGKFCAIIYRSF